MTGMESASFAPTSDAYGRTDTIKTLGNLFNINANKAENANSA